MVGSATFLNDRNTSVISTGDKATGATHSASELLPILSIEGNARGCLVRG